MGIGYFWIFFFRLTFELNKTVVHSVNVMPISNLRPKPKLGLCAIFPPLTLTRWQNVAIGRTKAKYDLSRAEGKLPREIQ